MIADAPPAIVPAIVVIVFAAGTAVGFVLVRQALHVRAAQLVRGGSAGAAREARAAISSLAPGASPAPTYASLAAALRHYLDARFGIESESLSGAELERAMTRAGTTRSAARMTAYLLERCDRMQDAGADPGTPDRIAADITNAREIVDLTGGAR